MGWQSEQQQQNLSKIIIFLQNRQMQCSKNLNKTQQVKKITQTKQQNQITYLMQSIQREKYSNTTNINLNMSIDKENQHHNQGRYSIKMRPMQYERNSGNVMVRSSFLQKGAMGELERSKERLREAPKIKIQQEDQMDKIVESLVYKLKKYLAITEAVLKNPTKIEQKLRKQAINTACELVEAINSLQQTNKRRKQDSTYSSFNSTGLLVLGQNKSLSSSYHFPNQQQLNSSLSQLEGSMSFIRKIQNLQQQKNQLESIISQNQREKIKMIIKIREGQSEQIEKYKRQLSSLFEKYKQLEKLVKKQSDRSKNLQLIIDQFKSKKQCGKLCELNIQQMRKKIIGFEEVVYEQNEYLSKALEEIENLKEKIKIYEKMQTEYTNVLIQLQKKQKLKPPSHTNKPNDHKPHDYSKSTCSSEFGYQTHHHNKYPTNTHSTELNQPFANITLKSPQPDESLLRMMLAQACVIDKICIRK